jgi:hypothetical protein
MIVRMLLRCLIKNFCALLFLLFSFPLGNGLTSSQLSSQRHNAYSASPFRMLLIGDSVDRYAVMDWCKEYNGSTAADLGLEKQLEPHRIRNKAWEIRIFDARKNRYKKS